MRLWIEWMQAVAHLRPACTRRRTYLWMVLVLMGLSIRLDLAGVTSFVRALGLAPSTYRRLLHLVHSPALRLDRLTDLWARWCRRSLPAFTVGAARVCIADGLKVPKEGRKMPAVKKLHQESANNSKPEFIFGHSFQCLSLLVRTAADTAVAVPLAARIGEGVVWSNRDHRSQLDRLVLLFLSLASALEAAVVLVADAYYASRTVILPLLAAGHHLVTRARSNAVAYEPAPRPAVRRRGRPRLYGQRMRLRDLFARAEAFTAVPSPVYPSLRSGTATSAPLPLPSIRTALASTTSSDRSGAASGQWKPSSVRIARRCTSAARDTRGAPTPNCWHAAASNIHAGMTSPVPSGVMQTKTASPPRVSRYCISMSCPHSGCHL